MTKHLIANYLEQLSGHQKRLKQTSLKEMFASQPDRFGSMTAVCGSILLDYSKNALDKDALATLLEFAGAMDLKQKRSAMFAGKRINETEGRSVLHTALRRPLDKPLIIDGNDVMADVGNVLSRMRSFAINIRSGEYCPSGKPIKHVVNIGIGGSDLGPRMAEEALGPYRSGPKIHFISNVDGADLTESLKGLDPRATVFIIASKTFTTQETMANASAAYKWMEAAVGEVASDHFVALSTNLEATSQFGIPKDRTFGFWDWVGGRYSVWSAIGLSLMIGIGPDQFRAFLDGAYAADDHFCNAELKDNIPVLLALIGFWHRSVCGHTSHAILPYDNRLSNLGRWMQQLDMESNGKSVMMDGEQVVCTTGPVIIGEPGTNGQHAFYQSLHQGTDIVPCDFIVAARGHEPELDQQHRLLVANCFAQSQALMIGRTLEEADGNPHRVFAGNRPSNTLLYNKLDPYNLGMLLAIYEHKIFTQGVLWGINSFDQWGVELGKELANSIIPNVDNPTSNAAFDASTNGLLAVFHKLRSE